MKENKESQRQSMKAYFLIANVLIAIFAFSYLVGADIVYSASPMPTGCKSGCEVPTVTNPSPSVSEVTPALAAAPSQQILSSQPGQTPAVITTGQGVAQATKSYFGAGLLQNQIIAAAVGAIGALVGSWAGGKDGELWGFVSFWAGATVYQILYTMMGTWALLPGAGVAATIFLLTYKQEKEEKVELNCLPWQAPIGGKDCEKCNELAECSEYACKSLGQACGIINAGTSQQKCVWLNPYDTNSPMVSIKDITKGYKSIPDRAVRPPATGVEIVTSDGVSVQNADCVKAFTPLEFTVSTDEPSQCKIDYKNGNLTDLSFFVGGDNLFAYNHTEKLSLPGPDTVNKIAPELKNDGIYTLFLKCQDANGNVNVNPFSVKFCVEKGPDTTAPYIVNVSVPSGSPIQYNKTAIDIEVYVNEPSECRWGTQDVEYNSMDNFMNCDTEVWQMNSEDVYSCKTTLRGLESRKTNTYYFKCKDQPWEADANRNAMQQSFVYSLIGTQPLNILSVGPKETIKGSTDIIPAYLTIKTDNGYDNGKATCYYGMNTKPERDEDWIQFLETNSNEHEQRQDLASGDYTYYFRCIDLGGNAVYNSTSFKIESDRNAPKIVRVYKESEQLKVMTNENAECSYSVKDCNFEIKDGIKMLTLDYVSHTSDWKLNQNYYIRCKDQYNNQPDPNTCSIIAKPSKQGSE